MKNRKALPIKGGAFFVENRLTPPALRVAPLSPAKPERGVFLFFSSAEQLQPKAGRICWSVRLQGH